LHKGLRKHKISSFHRFNSYILAPFLILALTFLVGAKFFSSHGLISIGDFGFLLKALLFSFGRLLVSYALALIVGVLLAVLATRSRRVEAFLLPIFDTLESVPILVFFPVIILFFLSYQYWNAAAIAIIFLNMLWNIVFSCVSGLKLIPPDVLALGEIFRLGMFEKFWKITLPSLFPYLVTGSLLAWAEGWNMLIVAEVLKTYVPKGLDAHDLFGIGSVLVNSSLEGSSKIFFGAVCFVVVAVILINIFIWQPLLKNSEKYRYD
jgi:NitT/TauT family transport system permease protein